MPMLSVQLKTEKRPGYFIFSVLPGKIDEFGDRGPPFVTRLSTVNDYGVYARGFDTLEAAQAELAQWDKRPPDSQWIDFIVGPDYSGELPAEVPRESRVWTCPDREEWLKRNGVDMECDELSVTFRQGEMTTRCSGLLLSFQSYRDSVKSMIRACRQAGFTLSD